MVTSRVLKFVIAPMMLLATSSAADTFSVKLGNSSLGTLSYTRSATGETLTSRLDQTPLGVFNGTFKGTSTRVAGASGTPVRQFVGISKSSRKSRKVTVQIDRGRAVMTDIAPAEEITPLSDPAMAPGGVMDPVAAVGRLISAGEGCPRTIAIYDGRRAIALTPTGGTQDGATLTCDIAYTVTAGPGHLSPLYISSARMRVIYAVSAGRQELRQITLRSGIFTVHLDKTG